MCAFVVGNDGRSRKKYSRVLSTVEKYQNKAMELLFGPYFERREEDYTFDAIISHKSGERTLAELQTCMTWAVGPVPHQTKVKFGKPWPDKKISIPARKLKLIVTAVDMFIHLPLRNKFRELLNGLTYNNRIKDLTSRDIKKIKTFLESNIECTAYLKKRCQVFTFRIDNRFVYMHSLIDFFLFAKETINYNNGTGESWYGLSPDEGILMKLSDDNRPEIPEVKKWLQESMQSTSDPNRICNNWTEIVELYNAGGGFHENYGQVHQRSADKIRQDDEKLAQAQSIFMDYILDQR